MKRPILIGAVVASAAMLAASLPLLAADAVTWPWKDKTPADPALVTLVKVDKVSAAIKDATVTISVEAQAATPGFSELQLAPRMGDPKDLVFAFDAKGRAPQDMSTQVITPVTFSVAYADAPVEKVGVVEVYGQENCKAFAIKDNKETECTSKSVPQ